MALAIGNAAPDFELVNQHGEKISLASYKGKKNVVLIFYPFAFSGICTGELCALRDDLSAFQNDNVELIAISCDPMYANKVFAEQEGYKFQVLSDFWPHGAISKAYGTFEESRGCAKRGTFIIGKDGNLKWQIVNGLGDARNITEYKAALSALQEEIIGSNTDLLVIFPLSPGGQLSGRAPRLHRGCRGFETLTAHALCLLSCMSDENRRQVNQN